MSSEFQNRYTKMRGDGSSLLKVTFQADGQNVTQQVEDGMRAIVSHLDAQSAPFEKDLFEGTELRVMSYLANFCLPWDTVVSRISAMVRNGQFNASGGNGVPVFAGPFYANSVCPHHLLPVQYKIVLGYIPANHVLGLSKIVRIAKLLSQRPVLQETLTKTLVWALHAESNPVKDQLPSVPSHGAATLIQGSHSCVKCRGVESNANITTYLVSGMFQDPRDPSRWVSFMNSLMQESK